MRRVRHILPLAAALLLLAGRCLSAPLSQLPPKGTANGQMISWSTAANGGAGGFVITTLGGDLSLSGTTLNLSTVGTAGTYAYPASVTTDTKGRVTAVTAGSAPTTYTAGTGIAIAGGVISNTNATATQTANTVYAGPASGAAANPTFRGLVSADLPSSPTVSGVVTANTLGLSALGGAATIGLSGTGGNLLNFTLAGAHALQFGDSGSSIDLNPVAGSSYAYGLRFYSGNAQGIVMRTSTIVGGEHSASQVPLTVKMVSGQTAPAEQVISSTSAVLQSVGANGVETTPAVLTAIATKTAAYTATATDTTLLLDTTGGTFAVTLPSASTAGSGHSYTLKWKAGTTAPTVSGTVDGGTLTFTTINQSRTITSDGTSWYITGGYL